MKTITVKVPDNKYSFFVELIEHLGYTKLVHVKGSDPDKREILEGIKDAVAEVQSIKKGKRKSVLLNDFLKGL